MARVSFEGVQLDSRTRDMFVRLRWKLGLPLVITQGSYSGGVSASAGTHNGGGALDIRASNLTTEQRQRVVLMARQMGFAAWLRNPSQGDWPYHIHGISIGTPDLHPSASAQVVDYKAGRNGLANNGPDDGPDGYRSMTWEKYEAAHPDEEWMMSVGDDILAELKAEAARNVARETVYANREVVEKGRYEDLKKDIADLGKVQDLELGRYTDVKSDLVDLREKLAALTSKVDALPKA
jgi:hypothetical protein